MARLSAKTTKHRDRPLMRTPAAASASPSSPPASARPWNQRAMLPDGRARTSTMLALASTLVMVLAGFALTMVGAAPPEPAEITVVWDTDGRGFNVTSSKDISNVIVLLCDESAHKHEAEFEQPKLKNWYHNETQDIVAIWVKSGSNHDPNGPAPPSPFDNNGAGEYFENPFDVCVPVVTTTPPTTTPPTTTEPPTTTPPTTTEPSTSTLPTTTTAPTSTEPPTTTPATSITTTTEPPQTTPPSTSPPPTTEIPVFPSTGALALGLLGALGSTFAVLRRRR